MATTFQNIQLDEVPVEADPAENRRVTYRIHPSDLCARIVFINAENTSPLIRVSLSQRDTHQELQLMLPQPQASALSRHLDERALGALSSFEYKFSRLLSAFLRQLQEEGIAYSLLRVSSELLRFLLEDRDGLEFDQVMLIRTQTLTGESISMYRARGMALRWTIQVFRTGAVHGVDHRGRHIASTRIAELPSDFSRSIRMQSLGEEHQVLHLGTEWHTPAPRNPVESTPIPPLTRLFPSVPTRPLFSQTPPTMGVAGLTPPEPRRTQMATPPVAPWQVVDVVGEMPDGAAEGLMFRGPDNRLMGTIHMDNPLTADRRTLAQELRTAAAEAHQERLRAGDVGIPFTPEELQSIRSPMSQFSVGTSTSPPPPLRGGVGSQYQRNEELKQLLESALSVGLSLSVEDGKLSAQVEVKFHGDVIAFDDASIDIEDLKNEE